MEDLYQILGVPSTAPRIQIRRAFQRLARKYHPDVSNEPDAEEMFKRIRHAYDVLNSAVERSNYDFQRRNQSSHNHSTEDQPDDRPKADTQTSEGPRRAPGWDTSSTYQYYHGSRTQARRRPTMPLGFVAAILISLTVAALSLWVLYAQRTPVPDLFPRTETVAPLPKNPQAETPEAMMSMEEFTRLFPQHVKPTCRSTFRPETIHQGEQTTHCYSYYGPVYKVGHAGSGVLRYSGAHEQDLRKGDSPRTLNFTESVLGIRRCGQMQPSKIGTGTIRSRYEGPAGVAICSASLTVLPPQRTKSTQP